MRHRCSGMFLGTQCPLEYRLPGPSGPSTAASRRSNEKQCCLADHEPSQRAPRVVPGGKSTIRSENFHLDSATTISHNTRYPSLMESRVHAHDSSVPGDAQLRTLHDAPAAPRPRLEASSLASLRKTVAPWAPTTCRPPKTNPTREMPNGAGSRDQLGRIATLASEPEE